MFVVGVTGGIGSGKSTVTNFFARLGVNIIDADVIARDLVNRGSPLLTAIAEHFEPTVLLENGELDRHKLREIIFTDSHAKQWLESLLHPEVRKQIQEEIQKSESVYTIVSAPLMIETGLDRIMNRLLVVDIPESEQIKRTVLRDNAHEENVSNIIASQVNRRLRLEKADDVIDNSGTMAETEKQVEDLHKIYLKLAEENRNHDG